MVNRTMTSTSGNPFCDHDGVQLCPQRARSTQATPPPAELRRAGFRERTASGCRSCYAVAQLRNMWVTHCTFKYYVINMCRTKHAIAQCFYVLHCCAINMRWTKRAIAQHFNHVFYTLTRQLLCDKYVLDQTSNCTTCFSTVDFITV